MNPSRARGINEPSSRSWAFFYFWIMLRVYLAHKEARSFFLSCLSHQCFILVHSRNLHIFYVIFCSQRCKSFFLLCFILAHSRHLHILWRTPVEPKGWRVQTQPKAQKFMLEPGRRQTKVRRGTPAELEGSSNRLLSLSHLCFILVFAKSPFIACFRLIYVHFPILIFFASSFPHIVLVVMFESSMLYTCAFVSSPHSMKDPSGA